MDKPELQKDPEGYLKWQAEQKGKAAKERKEREEQQDFEQFRSMFVERGGDPSKAREMYARYRNDTAFEEAKRHDKATREQMRSTRSGMV